MDYGLWTTHHQPRSTEGEAPMRVTRKMIEPFPNYTTHVMRCLGMEPDPWQAQVLEGDHRRLLLNCSRLAGKSTVVAVLALVEAIMVPDSLILLLAPGLRQSTLRSEE